MKLVRMLVVAVLVCGVGFAADRSNAEQSGSFYNGRYWKHASFDGKISFLFGANQSLQLMVYEPTAVEAKNEAAYNAYLAHRFWPDQLTFGEVAQALDSFYETPENAPIPIAYALQVVAFRANGGSEKDVQRVTEISRKIALGLMNGN